MLPPLASTSCTDMLILFLLLTNGLLFDMHKFELKKKKHIFLKFMLVPFSIRCLITYLVAINNQTPSRICHHIDLTQACTRVFQRHRVSWRYRLRCTMLLAVVPGSNSVRTPDRRNRRCYIPKHPSIPVRSPTSAPRK